MTKAVTEIDPSMHADQRVALSGAAWHDYERLLAIRGESAVPRITYLEGEIELMSPSLHHEKISRLLGLLVGVHALEHGLNLNNFGSWTIKDRKKRRGLEADECFVLGDRIKRRPDLAIEVVVFAPEGIDKLEVYRQLGVPEVWFWRDGRIEVHSLRGKRYAAAERSRVLPGLDLVLLARLAQCRSQADAVRRLRRAGKTR